MSIISRRNKSLVLNLQSYMYNIIYNTNTFNANMLFHYKTIMIIIILRSVELYDTVFDEIEQSTINIL